MTISQSEQRARWRVASQTYRDNLRAGSQHSKHVKGGSARRSRKYRAKLREEQEQEQERQRAEIAAASNAFTPNRFASQAQVTPVSNIAYATVAPGTAPARMNNAVTPRELFLVDTIKHLHLQTASKVTVLGQQLWDGFDKGVATVQQVLDAEPEPLDGCVLFPDEDSDEEEDRKLPAENPPDAVPVNFSFGTTQTPTASATATAAAAFNGTTSHTGAPVTSATTTSAPVSTAPAAHAPVDSSTNCWTFVPGATTTFESTVFAPTFDMSDRNTHRPAASTAAYAAAASTGPSASTTPAVAFGGTMSTQAEPSQVPTTASTFAPAQQDATASSFDVPMGYESDDYIDPDL